MNGCQLGYRDWTKRTLCDLQPATELRLIEDGEAVSNWQPACYVHAQSFLVWAETEGHRLEERPPAVLREEAPSAVVLPFRAPA